MHHSLPSKKKNFKKIGEHTDVTRMGKQQIPSRCWGQEPILSSHFRQLELLAGSVARHNSGNAMSGNHGFGILAR